MITDEEHEDRRTLGLILLHDEGHLHDVEVPPSTDDSSSRDAHPGSAPSSPDRTSGCGIPTSPFVQAQQHLWSRRAPSAPPVHYLIEVDLVMWRDVSTSAFSFSFGSFILLSSSYAKDLNFSSAELGSRSSRLLIELIYKQSTEISLDHFEALVAACPPYLWDWKKQTKDGKSLLLSCLNS